MWIVFGTGEKTTRVAGGARVERHCDRCGERTTFYEKEIQKSFRLYFIDVFDYGRQRVMACGGCGACYATDELGPPTAADSRSLGDEVGRVARRAGGFIERTADAVEARISSFISDDAPAECPREAARPAPAAPPNDLPEEDLDPLEERFRELERKVRVRID